MKYYNNQKEITQEEAHALKDKSKLCSSDKKIKFEKKEKKK